MEQDIRPSASYWIEKLQLESHVEGGSFRETYRSTAVLDTSIPGQKRNLSTSIYFLLRQDEFSAFHRIASDEIWHFHFGDTLIIYELAQDGSLTEHLLGNNPGENERFQCIIKAGNWFASRPAPGSEYTLAGCTVAPGFDFSDFELANRNDLLRLYLHHADLITSLTR